MIELGKVYTTQDLHNLYTICKESGYLQKWQFGHTVDNIFFYKFIVDGIPSEFWCTNEDEYTCIKLDNKSFEDKSEKFFTTGTMPSDIRTRKNYYTRYKGNKKESWNPVSNIGGTGSRTNELTK